MRPGLAQVTTALLGLDPGALNLGDVFVFVSPTDGFKRVNLLGSDDLINAAFMPAAVVGGVSYQGAWNATTNSPAIPAAAAGNKGWYYQVSVAGSTSINSITDWKAKDFIISNGTAWEKIDNTDPTSTSQIDDSADRRYVTDAQLAMLAASNVGVDALTDGATIEVPAAALYDFFTLTLGGNRTMPAPSGATSRRRIVMAIKQDGTGTRLITWNAIFRWPGATAPTLTTTPGATDYIGFTYNGVDSKWDGFVMGQNFAAP